SFLMSVLLQGILLHRAMNRSQIRSAAGFQAVKDVAVAQRLNSQNRPMQFRQSWHIACSFRERGRGMRQLLLGVVAFVGCLSVAGVAVAQDAPTPNPTATSSPTPSPTRTPGPILPSARAEVDRQRKLDATFMTRTQ